MTDVRRRKKRFSEAGVKTVELRRGRAGYGFSLSGQQPCVLSCVVRGSPAERAGLHTGDYLVSINATDVSNASHDEVVALVGSATGALSVKVAKTFDSSDSSEDGRSALRAKYAHRRSRSLAPPGGRQQPRDVFGSSSGSSSGGVGGTTKHTIITREARLAQPRLVAPSPRPAELPPPTDGIRVIIGYVGSIELPRSWGGCWGSVEGAVRRLRVEGRTQMRVMLQTSSGAGVRLQNGAGRLVAQYLPDELLSCSACPGDRRYLAMMTARHDYGSACHVFRVDPRAAAHAVHARVACQFGVLCARDPARRTCAEFPSCAEPVLVGIAAVCRGDATAAWRDASTSEWSAETSDCPTPGAAATPGATATPDPPDERHSAESLRRGVHRMLQSQRRNGVPPHHQVAPPSSADDSADSWTGATPSAPPPRRPLPIPVDIPVIPRTAKKPPLPGRRPAAAIRTAGGARPASTLPTPPPPQLMNTETRRRQEALGYTSDPGEGSVIGERPLLPPAGNEGHDDMAAAGRSRLGGASSLTTIATAGVVPAGGGGGVPPVLRAASWAVNFSYLLRDDVGVANFKEFLKKEFSEENLIFWMSCEDYKQLVDPAKRKVRAGEIFASHLTVSASSAVNVDSAARQSVIDAMDDAPLCLLDVPKQQIYQLMRQDSYCRFLRSTIYKECVIAEVEGRTLPHSSRACGGRGDAPMNHDPKSIKKCKSAAACGSDEKRRRSLLPWHRYRRLSRRQPSDTDLNLDPDVATTTSTVKVGDPGGDMEVGGGYLRPPKVSLDLADLKAMSREWKMAAPVDVGASTRDKLCRVTLPDGCTTVVAAGQTLHAALRRLCERRADISLLRHAAVSASTDKAVDMSLDVSEFGWQELRLERRVVLRVDIGGRCCVGLQVAPQCSVRAALGPVCVRYGVRAHVWVAHLFADSSMIDLDSNVDALDLKHVVVQTAEDFADWGGVGGRRHARPTSRWLQSRPTPPERDGDGDGDLSSRVFKDIYKTGGAVVFDELGVWDPNRKVDERPRTDANGRNTGLMALIRRGRTADRSHHKARATAVAPPGGRDMKPPIKRGSVDQDGEQLMELLSRAQRRQLDDQRGVTIGAQELPDFLKLPPAPTPTPAHTPRPTDGPSQQAFSECSFGSEAGLVPSHEAAQAYFAGEARGLEGEGRGWEREGGRGWELKGGLSDSCLHSATCSSVDATDVSLMDASAFVNGAMTRPPDSTCDEEMSRLATSRDDASSASTPSPTTHDLVLSADSDASDTSRRRYGGKTSPRRYDGETSPRRYNGEMSPQREMSPRRYDGEVSARRFGSKLSLLAQVFPDDKDETKQILCPSVDPLQVSIV